MKNNKGFTVVELISSFALAMVVFAFLFEIVVILKNTYINSGVRTELLHKQAILSSKINDGLTDKNIKIAVTCGDYCLFFIFDDSTTSRLEIDKDNALISWDDYTTKLVKNSYFGDIIINSQTVDNIDEGKNNSIITIKIPIYSANIENKDFGINIVYQYDSNVTSITGIESNLESSDAMAIYLNGSYEDVKFQGNDYNDPGYFVYYKNGEIAYKDPVVTINGTQSDNFGDTYTLTYSIVENGEVLTSTSRDITVVGTKTYEYTGDYQTFTAPVDGYYEVELWGAAGGIIAASGAAGNGAYIKGNIYLNKDDFFYVNVGGKGSVTNNTAAQTANGGFNGGGNGYNNISSVGRIAGSGGGATDIRIDNNKKYRYIRNYINGSSANTANHWVEIIAYDQYGTNVAYLKPVTGSVTANSTYPYTRITDGNTVSANYAQSSVSGSQYIEIDLGDEYNLKEVIVWHYYADSRKYKENMTVLYNSDRSVATTIYDSTINGEYTETSAGHTEIANVDSLKSRIMVAGGGGGAWYNSSKYLGRGGAGGELYGMNGYGKNNTTYLYPSGGRQSSVGPAGQFISTFGNGASARPGEFAGGGGGYYGGNVDTFSGGGGSSYISGYAGVNSVTDNSQLTHSNNTKHYSNYYFINGYMQANVNSDNGIAKISYIGKNKYKVNENLNKVKYIKDCINGSSANTSNHWGELQAIVNGLNVAYGKTVVGTAAQTSTHPYTRITDGDIVSENYAATLTTGNQCITVNLENIYNLDEVAIWHYYADGRYYKAHSLSVSSDNLNWTQIGSTNQATETANGYRINAYMVP